VTRQKKLKTLHGNNRQKVTEGLQNVKEFRDLEEYWGFTEEKFPEDKVYNFLFRQTIFKHI
jgi:hypothetical protein